METRSVSRCVAIAAHGKRCQQSPFRGSPYCWHHTQSRKIWAPSRPMGTGTAVAGRASAASVEQDAEGRLAASPEVVDEATALDMAGRRLAELLGPRGTEDLLAFLEGGADGTYVIMRSSEGGLIGERSIGDASPRRRTA
jgi:hypothetical protein